MSARLSHRYWECSLLPLAPLLQKLIKLLRRWQRPLSSSVTEGILHGETLKDHLLHQQGLLVQAYETGARAGHNIRDILESMLSSSAFAILVLAAEDEMADETLRARQNVVHEVGLFQGRLGWHRALLLVENDVDLFSNIDGIQQIRYPKGHIKETYGDVLATLRRKFGISVSRN